jgi:hypothetical protein
MSLDRIPYIGRVMAYSKVIQRARLLAAGLPRGSKVRFEEIELIANIVESRTRWEP